MQKYNVQIGMRILFYLGVSLCYTQAYADQSCPAFLTTPKHALKQVQLFNREGDNRYDLAPSSDKQNGKFANVRWDDLNKSDLPVYFECSYFHTNEIVSGHLTASIKQCWHHFPYVHGVILEKGNRCFRCK